MQSKIYDCNPCDARYAQCHHNAEANTYLPRVVSTRIFKKYSTQAFPSATRATTPEISTFNPWTNICPMTCFDTSNDLWFGYDFEQVSGEGSYSIDRRTMSASSAATHLLTRCGVVGACYPPRLQRDDLSTSLIPSHLYTFRTFHPRRSFHFLVMSMFGDDDIFDDIPVDHRSCRLLGPTALVSPLSSGCRRIGP